MSGHILKKIINKYRLLFPQIPLTLFTILVTLILGSLVMHFVIAETSGFFVNIISELLGLLITLYIVSGIFFKRDKEQWKEVEEIINTKCRAFVNFFYLNLIYHFNISILNKFTPLEQLRGENTTWEIMREQITGNVRSGFYHLTGDELKKISRWLTEAKTEIEELISYMEKRPQFLQKKILYQIEFLIEEIQQDIKVYDLIYKLEDDEVVYNKSELNKITFGFDKLLSLLVDLDNETRPVDKEIKKKPKPALIRSILFLN